MAGVRRQFWGPENGCWACHTCWRYRKKPQGDGWTMKLNCRTLGNLPLRAAHSSLVGPTAVGTSSPAAAH